MCKTLLQWLCLTVFTTLSGCGGWNIERHEAAVAAHIDTRLSMEMTREDFLTAFPDVERIDEQNDSARYLMHEEFICFSSQAFRRTAAIFARVVVFEGDRLSAVEPVKEIRP